MDTVGLSDGIKPFPLKSKKQAVLKANHFPIKKRRIGYENNK